MLESVVKGVKNLPTGHQMWNDLGLGEIFLDNVELYNSNLIRILSVDILFFLFYIPFYLFM